MRRKSQSLPPPRSPVYFGPISNGEFLPRQPTARDLAADRAVHQIAEASARRLGISRRAFLQGPCGMAAALSALNAIWGCEAYRVTRKMSEDPAAARAVLGGGEFIVDAQTHHIDASPRAVWPLNNPPYASLFQRLSASRGCGRHERFACVSRETYLREIFVQSDTALAVLSGVPSMIGKNPLGNEEIAATRDLVNQLAASQRVIAQGVVHPNLGSGELEGMHELKERANVAGWKVYTPWGPDGSGWFLDDEAVAFPFLERAQKLGRPLVFCHKGLPWPNFNPKFCSPRDVGPAARAFPGIQFVVYHSGYEVNVLEGPYDPYRAQPGPERGVNRLIQSLEDAGLWPNQNVYAELGGTWGLLMTRPVEAAHVLGKLLKHLGEDRVLWGTDALFLGAPQPQIEAFRAFEIPEEMQEKYGYPALTPRVKAKVFGLNAAALLRIDPKERRRGLSEDDIQRAKQAFDARDPVNERPPLYGPRTRRELFNLWAVKGGHPG